MRTKIDSKLPGSAVSVDFKKAFDKIGLSKLFLNKFECYSF